MKRLGVAALLVIAFAVGGVVTYAIMSERREEWGLVVAGEFEYGSSLWGLFETKDECLKMRAASMEKFTAAARDIAERTGKTSRTVLIKPRDLPETIMTFSCLPLSTIRGLPLSTGSGAR